MNNAEKPLTNLLLLCLLVALSALSGIATERVELDGTSFKYENRDQLRERCSKILKNYDESIKRLQNALQARGNPFSERSKTNLATNEKKKAQFLAQVVVDPARTVTCPTCHGAKKILCSGCNGSGKKKCVTCNGTGKVSHWLWWDTDCSSCKAQRTRHCPNCWGSGNARCYACGATGVLLQPVKKLTVAQLLNE